MSPPSPPPPTAPPPLLPQICRCNSYIVAGAEAHVPEAMGRYERMYAQTRMPCMPCHAIHNFLAVHLQVARLPGSVSTLRRVRASQAGEFHLREALSLLLASLGKHANTACCTNTSRLRSNISPLVTQISRCSHSTLVSRVSLIALNPFSLLTLALPHALLKIAG